MKDLDMKKTYYHRSMCPVVEQSNKELSVLLSEEYGREFQLGIAIIGENYGFGTIELEDDEVQPVGKFMSDNMYILYAELPTLEQCESGEIDSMEINDDRLQELILDSATTICYYGENNYQDGVLDSHIDDIIATIRDTKPELFAQLQDFSIEDVRNRVRIELEEDRKDFADAYSSQRFEIKNFVTEYTLRNNINMDAESTDFSARANGKKVIINLISGTNKHQATHNCDYEADGWEELSWGKFKYIVLPTIEELSWNSDRRLLDGALVANPNTDWSAFVDTNEDGVLLNAEFCKLKQAIEIASEALGEKTDVFKLIRNETTIDVLFKLEKELNVAFPISDIYFAYVRYQDEGLQAKIKLALFGLVKKRSKAEDMLAGFDFFDAVDDLEYTQNFEREYATAVVEQNNIRANNLIKKHNAMRMMYGEEYYDYNMLYKYLLSDVVATISRDLGTTHTYDMVENFMKLAGIHGSSEYFDGKHYSQSKSLSEKDKDLILNWFAKDNWIPSDVLLKELDINERTFKKYAYGTTSGEYTYKPEYIENLHWITSNNTRLYNRLAVEWHSISRGTDKPFIKFAIDKNLVKNIK